MKGSSYTELPRELSNNAKGLINIKNKDKQCFRWCHIRYLSPQDNNPQRIKKSDKDYIKKLDYSGTEFPVTISQINKIEKQNDIRINVFGYEQKTTFSSLYFKGKPPKCYEFVVASGGKIQFYNQRKKFPNHLVLIKDFNKFMYDETIKRSMNIESTSVCIAYNHSQLKIF